MGKRNFLDLLQIQWDRGNFVCVGLDSEFGKIPESAHKSGGGYPVSETETIVSFNRAIVDSTKDIVCAYKLNSAFYEAHGAKGIDALQRTISYIHAAVPDVPVILDAKRADIGNTNTGYVQFAFENLVADAITVNPYLGSEALAPFLDLKDKGIFVLCRTSNEGGGEFQDLTVTIGGDEADYFRQRKIDTSWNVVSGPNSSLFLHLAYRVATHWNKNGNCAVVAGATYPDELRKIRGIVGDMPILIPGIGAQGGNLEETVRAGKDSHGQGMIINSSRGIIFASNGPDFAEVARRETEKLRDLINQFRQ